MKAFCLIQFALRVRRQKCILCAETLAFRTDFWMYYEEKKSSNSEAKREKSCKPLKQNMSDTVCEEVSSFDHHKQSRILPK